MEQRPGNNFRFDGPFYGREGYHDDSWWNGPLHAIVLLLLIALLVVAVVWLFRRFAPTVAAQTAVPAAVPAAALQGDPAVATLRMRYAKGEVSRDDYLNGMSDLTGIDAPTRETWPGNDPGEATPPTPI
jgi:uncharacterized membrane protein